MGSSSCRTTAYDAAEPAETSSYTSDQELTAAILVGDELAAGVLYDRLRPVVDHALRRVLHTRFADFDDLVQATFERIIRALATDRFEGRSSLRTWAAAIAGRVAMDALRCRYREKKFLTLASLTVLESPKGAIHGPERRLEARSEIRRLHEILARMKPHLADTLILHDVLGHDLSEIADITGAKVSAAQSRLLRARKELVRRAAAKVGGRNDNEEG